MAWTAPMTFTAGTALTAAQLNTHLRDNLNQTEISQARFTGAMIMSDAANSVTQRLPHYDINSATGSTIFATYGDLDDPSAGAASPRVTVTCGTKALVFLSCEMHNDTSSTFVLMSNIVFGATPTIVASDEWALGIKRATGNKTFNQASNVHLFTGLTPGVNTFTAQYRVTAGRGYYNYRRMLVIPF